LAEKDRSHLEKLRNALSATHPIKTYPPTGYGKKPYCRLIITSPLLCQALTKLEIVERKTFTLKFPKLSAALRRHFIRGYFDGDGCWAKSKKSASGFTMKICGNYGFLQTVATELQLNHSFIHQHKTIFVLEKSGKDVLRLMDHLYRESTISLERKKERWAVAQSLLLTIAIE